MLPAAYARTHMPQRLERWTPAVLMPTFPCIESTDSSSGSHLQYFSFVHVNSFPTSPRTVPTSPRTITTRHVRGLWVCRKGRSSSNSSENASGAAKRGRGRAAKRASLYDAMKMYSNHFRMLLENELEAEQASFQALQRKTSRYNKRGDRKASSAALKAIRRSRVYSNDIYELVVQGPSSPELLDFSKGDLIDVFPLHSYGHGDGSHGNEDEKVQGMVMSKSSKVLTVTFPLGSDGANCMYSYALGEISLGVERGTNALAYERALSALDELTKQGPGTSLLARLMVISFRHLASSPEVFHTFSKTIPTSTPLDLYGLPNDTNRDIDRDNNGQDIVVETRNWEQMAAERMTEMTPQKVAEAMRRLPKDFNSSQRSAVRTALSRRLTLIQGPPGTGKTAVAAAIICCASQLGLGPILATTASNVAADNLMRRILSFSKSNFSLSSSLNESSNFKTDVIDAGRTVLRYGRASAVADDLWLYTVDAQLERDSAVRDARATLQRQEGGGARRRGVVETLIKAERAATNSLLNTTKIVVATCVGSGSPELNERKFAFIVVDEATQATEPDTLMPLHRESVRQVVMVGDHHQLPPTTRTRCKGKEVHIGLETSLFQRLWACNIHTVLLNIQYRMHPLISSFPNMHFYNGRLRDGVKPHQRPLSIPLSVLTHEFQTESDSSQGAMNADTVLDVMVNTKAANDDVRTLLVDVCDGEEQSDSDSANGDNNSSSFSLFNTREADTVSQITSVLITRGFEAKDIAVISPYAAQVRSIRNRLLNEVAKNVEVNTVDAFQGREQNVIIISAVRSNGARRVGFLADWRRLNVAITRAQALIVVVCDKSTVSADIHWRSWISWIEKRGLVVRGRKSSG